MPPPKDLKEAIKAPWWQQLIPILVIVMILVVVVAMFTSGARQFNPYMLMMFSMMALGPLSYMGVGGQGGGPLAEIDIERKSYHLELRELRKEVHARGRALHLLQMTNFPNPKSLLSLIGTPTMWQAGQNKEPQNSKYKGPPKDPYLLARIGVGIIRMYPAIKKADIQIPENMEPLTTIAHTRFYRFQNYIPNTPIVIPLSEHAFHAFQGDPEVFDGVGRAMITSLAYNHSPSDLSIGIVSSRLDDDWDWMKWLPHTQDRDRNDVSGTARMSWRTLDEFGADMHSVISEKGAWTPSMPGEIPHYVIFIDSPGEVVSLPKSIPPTGVAGMSFVILRRSKVTFADQVTAYNVYAKGTRNRPRKSFVTTPDQISVLEAEVIAQKMSRYRPSGWGSSVVDTGDDDQKKDRTFFDVLEIEDISKFDPRDTWRRNGRDSNFNIPLGFKYDGDKATDSVVYMDFGEASVKGTGPHGLVQGVTGAGKSFLLDEMVLSLCTLFGPEKLNLILMDFKGGATFPRFQFLPHVVANITNLDSEVDMVARVGDVIEGEIIRRENWLKKHNAKDIVTYRKMSLRDPEAHPPMANLIIIADEFREFLLAHPEYTVLFSRVGAVGRALGMQIVPCSQFIDSSLIRELMEHLSFGISLKASSDAYSRAVLKTAEASNLPTPGHAIIRQLDRSLGEKLHRFVGFNVEQQYIPPVAAVAIEEVSHETPLIESFKLTNTFHNEDKSKDTDGQVEPSNKRKSEDADVPQDEQMKEVLIRHLSRFDEVKARQLWQPTLRAPITFANVGIQPAKTSRLEFRVGDIDAPKLHKRLPYMITPESGDEHIVIVGRSHSGRSTAVEALVCASGRAYPARWVSWYLIDYGGTKLAEVATMPNVGGYATKSNEELINRFIGEVTRVRDLRERTFSEQNISSFDAYLEFKGQLTEWGTDKSPVREDPYGHMFLVIDGWTRFIKDRDTDEYTKDRLNSLLNGGGRYGIHLVATVEDEVKMYSYHQFFGSRIHLKVDDPASLSTTDREIRSANALIPVDQPGRAVDPRRKLAARILVPQLDRIEPVNVDPETQQEEFDQNADYSSGIRTFSAKTREAYTDENQLAPRIETVPEVIPYRALWTVYDLNKVEPDLSELVDGKRRAIDIHHPLGISAEDLTTVLLPDSVSSHMLVLGDPRKGKTEALRTVLNSIVRQFTPDEAQIVLVEPSYELLPEKQLLEEMGYLMAYADSTETLNPAVSMIGEVIRPRNPSVDQNLSMKDIRNRSWYSGPEVFVLVDSAPRFGTGSTPMDTGPRHGIDALIDLIRLRSDIGLHVYATGQAQRFSTAKTQNKLYEAMLERNTAVLMLSGPPGEGAVFPGVKFQVRREGEAMLYTPDNENAEVLQLGHSVTWEDPDGAPPPEIIARAKAVYADMLASRVGAVEKPAAETTFFDILHISDIEVWDPKRVWAENSSGSNLSVPIGFRHDGTRILDDLITLDICEPSKGGTGPHGAVQGMTGAGKSFWLAMWVLTLCATYAPDKISFILMDFKGGATFPKFERLPHVIANITNLDNEEELMARLMHIIEGEILRREAWLRDHGAKDIVVYRNLSEQDPVTYPPMADLVVIADEFREFMLAHEEYRELFQRIGAVGRALGMHVLPCSQVVDMSLIRDLKNHLTFGISLRAPSDSASKEVIGTVDAAKLALKSHQAYIRKSDSESADQIYRFIGFNTDTRYVPPSSDLEPLGDGKPVPESEKMGHILFEKLCQYTNVLAPELWKPTLRAPITFADVEVHPAETTRLEFRIGDIDAPRKHARIPYIITPDSGNEHVLIMGRGHSGKSTVVQAMACSSALSYPPSMVSWYLIDYGGTKLAEIANLPNVGAYTSKTDTEKVERIISEVLRIRDLRERVFSERGLATLDAYLDSRVSDPVPGDPYGHMFLVIDGINSYVKEHLDANDGWVEKLLRILDGSGRYGLHLVSTADSDTKIQNHVNYYGTKVFLKVEEAASLQNVTRELRDANRLLPSDQPGRAVDPVSGLLARVLVPQDAPIEPIGTDAETGLPEFDDNADYAEGIRAFSERVRSTCPEPTPEVHTVEPVVDYHGFWETYTSRIEAVPGKKSVTGRRRALDVHFPLGISAEDLDIVTVPDAASPHLLVVGDPKSGRTETLRTMLNTIVRQFGPDEAQIVIAETKYALLPEKELLEQMGYLFAYADSKPAFDRAIRKVDRVIRPRNPSLDKNLTMSAIRNRSWYSGPEVFVLIDNAPSFGTGAMDMGLVTSDKVPGMPLLIELIGLRSDLGLHVYATGHAQRFYADITLNKLYEAMKDQNTSVVMLSGPANDPPAFPGTKFALRGPGRALMYSPDTSSSEVLQVAHSTTWEEPEGAPSDELIRHAREVFNSMSDEEKNLGVEPEDDSSGGKEGRSKDNGRSGGSSGRRWGLPG
jgi:S-DNA-T family DNA segregation ATPase FtsK/SpoIIIE